MFKNNTWILQQVCKTLKDFGLYRKNIKRIIFIKKILFTINIMI
jgi:hypothetical protein